MGIAFRGKQIEFCHETYSVDRLKLKNLDKQESESTEIFLDI
jgi:hypothetical protein